MYMYVRQSENVYSKFQIQAANLQNQEFETVFTVIDSFRPCLIEMCRNEFLRIFTNFKTLGHEFSIYENYPSSEHFNNN